MCCMLNILHKVSNVYTVVWLVCFIAFLPIQTFSLSQCFYECLTQRGSDNYVLLYIMCVCVCPCMSVYVCAFCFLCHFLLCFGCQGTGPASQPVSGPTNLENPTHPILPKRVTYYQASFDRTTTVSQVSIGWRILWCSNHFNAIFYSQTVVWEIPWMDESETRWLKIMELCWWGVCVCLCV